VRIYLLAENNEPGLFLECHGAEDLGNGEGKERARGVGVVEYVDGAVGAHGECRAEGIAGLGRADSGSDDLGGSAGLAEPERLLHGDLAEGVHRHLDIGCLHACPVQLHADFDSVVHHSLHRHKDLHGGRSGVLLSLPLSLERVGLEDGLMVSSAAGE
jgi:hypothetical protein